MTATRWKVDAVIAVGLTVRLNPVWAAERQFITPKNAGQVRLGGVPYGDMEVLR